MSYNLWRSLLERDVDSFRQHLANVTYTSAPTKVQVGPSGGATHKIGSPGGLATSPRASFKSRKSSGHVQPSPLAGRSRGIILTRGDLNARDSFGRSLLHHAASQQGPEAHEFVKALLNIPFVDLYIQDAESGWTPLHLALYFGNIASAQALMQRDFQDATDYTIQASHTHAGGLVKIKDNEGNSPFEVFGLTIAPRDIQSGPATIFAGVAEDESSNSVDLNDENNDQSKSKHIVRPTVDLRGDEVFAFGSNKNLSLGVGDEDDRHFPERLQFARPEHLLVRLFEDHLIERSKRFPSDDLASSAASVGTPQRLPTLIRNKPVVIQDVVMSKLHTAVLTTDPISNLYICGFGSGGRLGTGEEATLFTYKCIQGGGLAKRRISTIALGQDHTIAVCFEGEVFTWGSNRFGQLGYALPEVAPQEVPTQLIPRQLYGYVKKETVIGAAASSIHSAVFTASSLFTFGKNEGQLGFMDADARSLEIQSLPRRVAPSVLQAQICAVTAINRATTVLLENHDVIVFTHYGWTKVVFPLEGFANSFAPETLSARYKTKGNFIHKVTSGGNTICAMSSLGEVFTIEVPKVRDAVPSNVSTTNPSKARNALPPATKVWSIRKDHMSAMDVAVSGQDGSIILCTTSGSVWRKEKRANIKAARKEQGKASRPKDYKFVRAPNLSRAVAVRSNAYGAFVAIRRDCDVTREQILVEPASLWSDVFHMLCFRQYGEIEDIEGTATPQLRFGQLAAKGPSPARIKRAVITSPTAESDILQICQKYEPLAESDYDVWITSNVTDVRIPVHSFLLKSRSKILRSALVQFQESYYFSIPDILSIEYGQDGQIQIQFEGADFLTIINLVLYLYADEIVDVWYFTSKAPQSAARYRTVRTELMKIAAHLELPHLERATRLMIDPAKSICLDMETAIMDSNMFADADVIVGLAEGAEQPAHSVLLCARCPFFDGLFNGRAGGLWVSSRRGLAEDGSETMRVDLKHVDNKVFSLVLRHMYADTGVELFDDVLMDSFDEFADLVLEVMSIANELMIDRLAQICQVVLGKFVTMRNVCGLLNAIAQCSVTEFKQAALEYMCLNLEGMMEQRLLEELDPALLEELDEVVQQNQMAFMPFARSGRAEAELSERHRELPDLIDRGRRRRIDSMRLRSRLVEDEQRTTAYQKFRVGSLDDPRDEGQSIPSSAKEDLSPGPSPVISAKDEREDLPFEMDEDTTIGAPPLGTEQSSPGLRPQVRHNLDEMAESFNESPQARSRLLRTPENADAGSRIASPPDSSSGRSTRQTAQMSDSSKKIWQASPCVGEKVDLKNIMDQASATRISGITQSMGSINVGLSRPVAKVSQKERRKLHQQLKTQAVEDIDEKQPSLSSSKLSSPWQSINQQRKASPSSALSIGNGVEGSPSSTLGRPTMTMRQTVAGSRSSENAPQLKHDRAKSTPGTSSPAKPSQAIIKSIRHTPAPPKSRSAVDARTSMADILSQQQIEKTSIKEPVEKRSLQEIQQEQEFQEWWDNESKRVQDEEARSSAAANRRSKSGRGRGGRGRGGARGGTAKSPHDESALDKRAAERRSSVGQKRSGTSNSGPDEGGVRGQ